jgi:hypothetical protein
MPLYAPLLEARPHYRLVRVSVGSYCTVTLPGMLGEQW